MTGARYAAFRLPSPTCAVYRDWLVGLGDGALRYVAQLCHKRYAEMDEQITALYTIAQQAGRDDFVAALELAAEQHSFGAEYVPALLATPRWRPTLRPPQAEPQPDPLAR